MAEIGMGKGAGVGSFGAGFGRGLARALLLNRERADQKRREEQDRKDRYFSMMMPFVMANTDWKHHPEDAEGFLRQHAPEFFDDQTQTGKTAKKTQGGKSGLDHIKDFLGPFLGRDKGSVIESGWPGGPVTMGAGHVGMDSPEQGGLSGMLGRSPGPFGRQPEASPSHQPTGVTGGTLDRANEVGAPTPFNDRPPDISQSSLVAPQAPPARHTLFGMRVLTDEEKAQRAADAEVAGMKQKIEARRAITATRTDMSPEDKKYYELYGEPPPRTASQALRYGGTVTGADIPESTLDIFGRPREADQTYRVELLPDGTQRYIPTVSPTSTQVSLQRITGTLEGEAPDKVRTFFVNPKTREITEQDGTPVTKTVTPVNQGIAPVVIQTADGPQLVNKQTATAQPIKTAEGQAVQPAPTAEMRNREAARKLVIPGIDAIEKLSQQVITHIGPAQRADALKRGAAAVFGSDPQYRTYQDARYALAGNLAVAQQGSRPSDADIKAGFLPLVPDVYADTTESAAMKWRLLRVIAGIPPKADEQGGGGKRGTSQTGGGLTMKDGKYYLDGVLMPGQ